MTGRRLGMLPVDDERGASTRYRVLAYRPALEKAGYRTRVRFPAGRGGRDRFRLAWRALDMLRDLAEGRRHDLLFVHRKTYPPVLARRLARSAHRLVFDMDDALDLPPPRKALSERASRKYRRNFEATVNAADLVLCGNRELAARLPHDRYAVLPTPLDTERFTPQVLGPPRPGLLGWVGHADNLGYLEAIADPLREVARRHPESRLVVVADRPPHLPGLEVEYRPWSLEREISCFEGIAIGLMPLTDTPWARCKCAFKALQYMALGIPAVASPVGMNRELIRSGENGFLAETPEEWVDRLDRLLTVPDLAATVGRAGRASVEREYSLRVNAARLISLLDGLV